MGTSASDGSETNVCLKPWHLPWRYHQHGQDYTDHQVLGSRPTGNGQTGDYRNWPTRPREGRALKIASLKVKIRFTQDGYDAEYEATFDKDALDDKTGQALLLYDNDQWGLYTSEEEADRSFHGYLPDTGLASAVRWARQRLQEQSYEVAFKFHADDPD